MPNHRPKSRKGYDENGLPLLIDSRGLSMIVGVTETRLHQLVRDSRINAEARTGDGYWHTGLALTELFGYYRRQADKARPSLDRELDSQVTMEDLRSRRIKNAKLAGELLPRRVYTEVFGELISVFKGRWLNFSHKMGPRCFRAKDKVEASEMLDREIRDIFEGLSDPRVMATIEASIRDDEFTDDRATNGAAAAAEETSEDMVTEDASPIL